LFVTILNRVAEAVDEHASLNGLANLSPAAQVQAVHALVRGIDAGLFIGAGLMSVALVITWLLPRAERPVPVSVPLADPLPAGTSW
jgi:hypothetical protein